MDDARFLTEMRRYWDEIARGGPATPGDLEPDLAAAIRRLHALPDVPPPDPTYANRLRESIMHASTAPIPLTIGPPLDGHAGPSISRPWLAPIRLPQGRQAWPLAQAAIVLLLIASLLIAYSLIFRQQQESTNLVPGVATPASDATPANDWPMYRGNPARTGEMSGPGPQGQPVELWRFQTQGPALRSPAIVGDVVYAGSGDGFLYALDRTSGDEIWRYQADGPVEITPTVIGDTVYLGSFNGTLAAVDAATGEERWRFAEAVAPDSTPVVADGALFIGSEDGILYALDPATGEERWRYAASGGLTRSIAVAGGLAYVGSEAGQLHAVDATSGEERWVFVPENAEASNIGTPTVFNGVVIAYHAGTLYALDAATGAEQWRSALGDGARPATARGDTLYTGGPDGLVRAIDAATGEVRWTFETGDMILAAPALVDDVLYVASSDHTLYALDAETGAERWGFAIDGDVDYGPAVANGVVYVSTNLGSVYAIGGSGTEQLTAPGTDEATPASVASPGASPVAGMETAPVEFVWRTTGGPEPLSFTAVLAIDPDGNLWVTDCGNNRFQIFAPDGTFLEFWGEGGSGDGQFNFQRARGDSVCGLAFAPNGSFYVADSRNLRVQQFDAERNFVRAWGSFGTEDGQFVEPIGVNVDAEGNVYVIDDERNDVQVFDSEGNFLLTFGASGSDDGQLDFPGWGAFDAEGNYWIADYNNNRIQQFAPDGTFLQAIGGEGSGDGQLRHPESVAVDDAGRVYVTDEGNSRIQVFSPDGQYLAQWTGDDVGGAPFQNVVAIALDGEGHVYVHDYSDGDGYEAVQKFRLLPPLS